MFTPFDNGPASHLYIVQPAYDPLMEYYAHEVAVLASAHAPCRSGRDLRLHRTGALTGPCGGSDQGLAARGAGARGDRMGEVPCAPEVPRSSGHVVPSATGAPGRWARLMFRLGYAFRPRRVLDA